MSRLEQRFGSHAFGIVVAGAFGISLALAGCARKQESEPGESMMASTAPEGALNIVAWAGSVERGEADSRFDWVSGFEARTGCKVTVTTAATGDEVIELLKSGGLKPSPPGDASWPPPGNAPFDLAITSGDVSIGLIRAGMVMPIDITRVPSYAAIDERLRTAPWHFVDGKHHGVPYQWGPNVLVYHTGVFQEPPGSWSVTFEAGRLPDGKPNKGRIQAYEAPIYIADAALYLKSRNPELGIRDPYELDERQYAAVLELLRAQKPLVQRYWHDANVQVQDFMNGGVVAAVSRPFQATTLIANRVEVAMTIPAEGATGWADTTLLATGARHPNCAYHWLEWSLSPKVQGDAAAWAASNPVVPKACEGNELLGPRGCADNGFADFDRLSFWRAPEAKCGSHPAGCVPYSRWLADYAAITGAN
jgi:putative spermidine/putrescine transport system substrate-binding protein